MKKHKKYSRRSVLLGVIVLVVGLGVLSMGLSQNEITGMQIEDSTCKDETIKDLMEFKCFDGMFNCCQFKICENSEWLTEQTEISCDEVAQDFEVV